MISSIFIQPPKATACVFRHALQVCITLPDLLHCQGDQCPSGGSSCSAGEELGEL